ncbi:MAG: lytic transglycosylase domain-containing protein [Thioalkalispiraceae bacterium]
MNRFKLFIFGGLALGLGATAPVQAGYYLYQLPDGSRLVSDRKQDHDDYKLVTYSRNVQRLGKLAAKKNDNWQAPAFNYMRFEPLIHQAASRHNVDAALVKAVIHTESYFNPLATSHKGASGLMQLMPQTAEQLGVTDMYNPRQNINAGTKYLSQLIKRYGNSLTLALAAYNAGERAVAKYRGVPPYKETQNYVKKVLKYRRFYSDWP